MGLFSKVGSAEVSFGGKYFHHDSQFIVRVEKVRQIKSRKNQQLVFIECTVCDRDGAAKKDDMNPEGSRASQCINFTEHDAAPGNMKAFVAAANGLDPSIKEQLDSVPEKEWEPLCDLAISEEQPCKGIYVGLETVLVKTRAGGPFTKHFWTPMDQEQAATAYGNVESSEDPNEDKDDD